MVPGPNFIWHIDGYERLKPYGFCIHGAIDGYSRRILWLEVGPSNNNPMVTVQYYLDCVRQLGGCPRVVRGDCGTENIHIAAVQRFLRRYCQDNLAGKKRAFRMANLWPTKGLRLGGLSSGRVTQTGGSVFSKI